MMRDQDAFIRKALLERQAVDEAGLERAMVHARKRELSVTDALVELGLVTSQQMSLVQADIAELPFVSLIDYEFDFSNAQRLPRALAERHLIFPVFEVEGVMTIAAAEPLDLRALDQVRQLVRCEIDIALAEPDRIKALIARAYSLSATRDDHRPTAREVAIEHDNDHSSSQPVVAAVNQLLADAAEAGASDIHINPDETQLRIRYRVDGVLLERQGPSLSMHPGIVQRLKVVANLDLTQSRRPQDGKFRFQHRGDDIEVRMSTLPTVCGENVVLRLLANRTVIGDFHQLGLNARVAAELEQIISRPNGMLLVTGPTGSGKTTTLYAALNKLNDPSRNVITIEDPVEIRLPYIRQVQVNNEIGLTFANALRSILRQDPDIVLVGEIRDNETATIALQAAMTGHFVLSTLHTNDAPGAVARLRDLGLPPFIINAAVLGVLAQRLVRRLCSHCATASAVDPALAERFETQAEAGDFQTGRGCAKCARTGYRGRVGIYEFLKFARGIQALVTEGRSVESIRDMAVRDGMRMMWHDGLEKARLGLTTLEEVAKATSLSAVRPLKKKAA
ncbi:MAG: GspE/PulE family protein [Phycisphaerales bacterium]